MVKNSATSLPRSKAAPATRKATVTRSLSSSPVARLTSTFSAISGVPPVGSQRLSEGAASRLARERANRGAGSRAPSSYAPAMPIEAPDPTVLHPVEGQRRVVFLKPLVRAPQHRSRRVQLLRRSRRPDWLRARRSAVRVRAGAADHRPLLRDRVGRALPHAGRQPRRPRAVDVPVRHLRGAVGEQTMDLVMAAPAAATRSSATTCGSATRRSCCPA